MARTNREVSCGADLVREVVGWGMGGMLAPGRRLCRTTPTPISISLSLGVVGDQCFTVHGGASRCRKLPKILRVVRSSGENSRMKVQNVEANSTARNPSA